MGGLIARMLHGRLPHPAILQCPVCIPIFLYCIIDGGQTPLPLPLTSRVPPFAGNTLFRTLDVACAYTQLQRGLAHFSNHTLPQTSGIRECAAPADSNSSQLLTVFPEQAEHARSEEGRKGFGSSGSFRERQGVRHLLLGTSLSGPWRRYL
jgi:hypothetical protein